MGSCSKHQYQRYIRLIVGLVLCTNLTLTFSQTLTLGPSLNLGAAVASNPLPNSGSVGFSGAVGGQAFLDFNDEFGVFFGLLSELRSFKQTLNLTDPNGVFVGTFIVQKKTTFVNLPIGFRIKIGRQHRWYFSGGGSFNQLVFEQDRVTSQFSSFFPGAQLSASKQRSEFALLGVLGYSFPIGAHSSVNIEWRNNFGLSDRSSIISSTASRERVHSLQLIFCFGKK